jgi:hypothetical protein
VPVNLNDPRLAELRRRLVASGAVTRAQTGGRTRKRTTRKELPDTDTGAIRYVCPRCGATFTSYRATTRPSPTCKHTRIEAIIDRAATPGQEGDRPQADRPQT